MSFIEMPCFILFVNHEDFDLVIVLEEKIDYSFIQQPAGLRIV